MKADIAKILSELIHNNGPQYVIPVYQRNYTWDDKNVGRLLSDIKRILDSGNNITHFIGSFVYVIVDTINIIQERAIVDGQQRLTTVFLSLYALRDIALEIGDEDKAYDIKSIYLENNVRQEQYKNKLKPLISDDTVFQSIIIRDFESIANNQALVYRNYLHIKDEFKVWIDEGHSIDQILNAIDQLKIVWVQLDKDEDAQQIFESINSAGDPLTASDLIRNFILMNKNDEMQTAFYENYWLKIVKYVVPAYLANNNKKASKKIEEFFRFYLASKQFVLTRIASVYAVFKDRWRDELKKGQTEESLLIDICNYAKHYNALYVNESICSGQQNELTVLRRIQSNMPAPFLMGIYEKRREGILAEEECLELIGIVNRYLMRRHMHGEDTSGITRVFPTLLKDVIAKCDEVGYDKIVDVTNFYLVNKNLQKASFMPTDEQIKRYLTDANAYVLAHTKTFFDIIENDNPIVIDLSRLTVEHVLPQTSTDYWLECVGDDKSKYGYYANLLGNLTIADKSTNSEMSNRNFDIKKHAMERVGRINLSKDIISNDEWDYKKIIARTKSLIKIFNKRFPYICAKADYENLESYNIFFSAGETHAEAILYSDGRVDILPNSIIRKCRNRAETLDRKLNTFIESGIIEDNNSEYTVIEVIGFTAVSTALDFIYGGSNNGWLHWKDENGNAINDSLRNKINTNV
ncbi:MAG: DUF4357 domain-containing protein [Bacillota bacterium]